MQYECIVHMILNWKSLLIRFGISVFIDLPAISTRKLRTFMFFWERYSDFCCSFHQHMQAWNRDSSNGNWKVGLLWLRSVWMRVWPQIDLVPRIFWKKKIRFSLDCKQTKMLQLKSIHSWLFGSDDEDDENTSIEKSPSLITKPANLRQKSVTSVLSVEIGTKQKVYWSTCVQCGYLFWQYEDKFLYLDYIKYSEFRNTVEFHFPYLNKNAFQ